MSFCTGPRIPDAVMGCIPFWLYSWLSIFELYEADGLSLQKIIHVDITDGLQTPCTVVMVDRPSWKTTHPWWKNSYLFQYNAMPMPDYRIELCWNVVAKGFSLLLETTCVDRHFMVNMGQPLQLGSTVLDITGSTELYAVSRVYISSHII